MTVGMAAEIEARVQSIRTNIDKELPVVCDMELTWAEWSAANDRLEALLKELRRIANEWIIPF